MTVQTVVQYGIQYVPGRRPVGVFGSYDAAEEFLTDNPPHHPDHHTATIVERIILTGDWTPAEKPQEHP